MATFRPLPPDMRQLQEIFLNSMSEEFSYPPVSTLRLVQQLVAAPSEELRQTYVAAIKRNAKKFLECTDHALGRILSEVRDDHDKDFAVQRKVFVDNMMHEMRTPLNSIEDFSDVLLDSLESMASEQVKGVLLHNSYLMMQIIENILISADHDGHLLDLHIQEFDFPRLFDEKFDAFRPWTDTLDIDFQKDNPYQSLKVKADPERIQQVIVRFVTNAVKFTPKGYVKLGYRLQDGGLYIYCEDSGIGIAQEHQKILFERFSKLDDYILGTGLGLHVCQKIADRCGGKVGLLSDGPGCGATFWFWFPIQS